MSHVVSFKAIKALLTTAKEEVATHGGSASFVIPICIAIQMLANIVEANEQGHISDTEPPPAPPTEPGDPT